MAYTSIDYKTRKELKKALAAGDKIEVYQPNGDLFNGSTAVADGIAYIEGPHYPKPHRWYARVRVKDGVIQELVS